MRIACLDGEPALVDGDVAYRLSGLLAAQPPAATAPESMLALVREWPRVRAEIEERGPRTLPRLDPLGAAWSAPIPVPGKIIGAPVNYERHREEMGSDSTVERQGVFLKASSSVIGPFADVVLPFAGRRTDQEGELAVVIGRRARQLSVDDALGCVLGYTCLLDITLRGPEDRSQRKSFDTFTPMGPWVATADEVGDPGSLRLRCWVNGRLRQDASTSDLICGVPELISYVSRIMTLEPGDVITTGTPAGVGQLAPGDHIALEIERVGRLEVGVTSGRMGGGSPASQAMTAAGT